MIMLGVNINWNTNEPAVHHKIYFGFGGISSQTYLFNTITIIL